MHILSWSTSKKNVFFQPLKDDSVLNAGKNNLDGEESPKKNPTPYIEDEGIKDCNDTTREVGELSKKIYRITPPGAAMQFTLKCDYRSHVTKANGEKSGIFPMLVFSKYRIDDKRPKGPNDEERRPWSKSFFRLQKLFYQYPRNSLLKLENEFD